jgi:hypothetical protein
MSNQIENSVAEALDYFRLGDRGPGERCFVTGDVKWNTLAMLQITVRRGKLTRQCEFLRSIIVIHWKSIDTALIEIPKCFLPIFCLWDFVLTEKEIERQRKIVEIWTAPYLPHGGPKVGGKVESIGGIRI